MQSTSATPFPAPPFGGANLPTLQPVTLTLPPITQQPNESKIDLKQQLEAEKKQALNKLVTLQSTPLKSAIQDALLQLNCFIPDVLLPIISDYASIGLGDSIQDELMPEPQLSAQTIISEFATPNPVSNAMCRFDARMRQLSVSLSTSDAESTEIDSKKKLVNHVLSTLATQTQLVGWKLVQDYVNNPTKVIDALLLTGETLVKQMLQRLEWVLDLQTQAKEDFDPDFFLTVLSTDKKWMDETIAFTRDAELKVTDLLKKNVQQYSEFRGSQGRRMRWPHSPELRKDIEAAEFKHKPMIIKRDRCVCNECKVEIVGWRPWHNPWQLHDLSRHTPDFHERVKQLGSTFPQTGASAVPQQPTAK